MPRKKHTPDEIVDKLRQVDVLVSQGSQVADAVRQDGLKVPPRQPKRSRIWTNDGACTRLRAERPNHVWS